VFAVDEFAGDEFAGMSRTCWWGRVGGDVLVEMCWRERVGWGRVGRGRVGWGRVGRGRVGQERVGQERVGQGRVGGYERQCWKDGGNRPEGDEWRDLRNKVEWRHEGGQLEGSPNLVHGTCVWLFCGQCRSGSREGNGTRATDDMGLGTQWLDA
jgi:hypothetical protein